MGAIKFTEKIVVDKPPAYVFDYTQDYGKRLVWDTFLKKADLIDGATEPNVGVKAWCVARNGLGMETEYVTYQRPKVAAIKMTRGPYLFSSFLGSWNFKQLAGGKTEVSFLYSFSFRFPFSLFTSAIKGNLQKNVRQRLADLKKAVEAA